MHRDTELHLGVKPYKNGCRCPDCGRRGRIVHRTTEPRRWEDSALMGLRIVLWYAPKEIRCPTHGRVQEEIPWAPASARVTYRLEWRLCALCQIMTQKAAAEILRMPTSTLSNLLHRVITRVRHGHTIRSLITLGVDEISYCKGPEIRHPRLRPGPGACPVGRPGQGPRHHRPLLQRLVEPGAKSGLYPDFPKGINTMYPYILRGKLSVRPAQVGGIDVNTLLSKLSWLLRIPNVDRILPLGRGATVRQGPRTG